jgi:3-hydroxyisobutyrate dehydrogenase-like beta-hydroxyacid dehydrogenase
MTTIGILGMGAMGAGIAGRLQGNGARILTDLAGRSGATRKRAEAAGAQDVGLDAMIAGAEMILSVIPPSSAVDTARRVAARIAASPHRPMFIDANAIAPQTTATIFGIFRDNGLPFGDASIIGAPPKADGPGPRFYMSGPVEREAGRLRALNLDARVLSPTIGDASALKMAYAGITKGFQALGTAMILGAARNGALDSLIEELEASQGALTAWLRRQLPTMYAKAYRWDGEMREIAGFLEPEAGSTMMLTGAAELYVRVAEDNAKGPESEIISVLDCFCGTRT